MNLAIKSLKNLSILVAVMVGLFSLCILPAVVASAQTDIDAVNECEENGGRWDDNRCNYEVANNEQGYVKSDCEGDDIQAGLPEGDPNHCGILDIIVLVTNTLAAMVGIVVVASIVYGGIQYSSAGSDPQKISAAKDRIRNAIIALLFFIFTYSLLNWLVPGGVL